MLDKLYIAISCFIQLCFLDFGLESPQVLHLNTETLFCRLLYFSDKSFFQESFLRWNVESWTDTMANMVSVDFPLHVLTTVS